MAHIYDRVYLLGVDGAGNFFTKSQTPNINKIFADGGAYNHFTVTSIPTISAQCWGSMLLGVSPQAHRLTNGVVGENHLPEDFPFASVFKLARANYPECELVSISNWNPINYGIIEQDLNVHMGTGDDAEVCEQVCESIEKYDPKLLFVQFDSVDGAGHHFGYGTQGHLDQIAVVDSYIGKIYETAKRKNNLGNTLFIVTADHGGTPEGGHGGSTKAEQLVSFYALGESVIPGEFGYMEIRDTASIIAFALGMEQPGNWSGRIPDGLFKDAPSFERPSELSKDGKKRYSDRTNLPTPTENGKTIADFTKPDGMRCYFPFDGDALDKAGLITAEKKGKLYFTEGFYGLGAKFDDSIIECGEVNTGTVDYTFTTWVKIDRKNTGDKWVIFSTMADDNDKGVRFYIQNENMVTEIGLGDGRVIHQERPLPGNYLGNWFHYLSKYNRNSNELCYYYDFAIDSDWYSDIKIPKDLELNGSHVTIGNYAPVTLDDLIMWNHNLRDDEIEMLRKYYEQK